MATGGFSERCLMLLVAIYYNIVVTLQLIKLTFTLGPRAVFVKKTFTKPEVLTDPSLGVHGFLQLDEVRIHFVSNGPEDKPLMLFLHGFPEFWYSWRYQIREFKDTYRVVAIDLRGFGESDKPKGVQSYQAAKVRSDIEQVILGLGYDSCILVGHDMGGVVAWSFSRYFPDMVNRLVIMNAPASPVMAKLLSESKDQLKMSWYIFLYQLPFLPELFIQSCNYGLLERMFGILSTTPIAMTSPPLKEPFDQGDIDAYKYIFSQPGALTGGLNYYRTRRYKREPLYTMDFSMPVLLIWGMNDTALHHSMPDVTKQMCPNITVERIHEAGHFVQMDTPREVNKLIRDWLNKESS